jgi:hypothetical protein
MTEQPVQPTRPFLHQESIINALSIGSVFILLGIVFVLALPSSLFDRAIDFFGGFTLRAFPGTSIYLPVPITPSAHVVVYTAVFQFCLGIGMLQILILAIRFLWRSPVGRVAETFGHLIFWLGTSAVVATFLNSDTTTRIWFAFWGAFLLVIGFSLLARAAVILIYRH